jgi:hypothetical protein
LVAKCMGAARATRRGAWLRCLVRS